MDGKRAERLRNGTKKTRPIVLERLRPNGRDGRDFHGLNKFSLDRVRHCLKPIVRMQLLINVVQMVP
jgi:hypothetical protein